MKNLLNYFITKHSFTDEQIELINEPTPEEEIEFKEDENGFKYKTVTGAYMKRRMNLIFGHNYDFEILGREYFSAGGEVLVHGRLTVRSGKFTVIKEQFGKHLISLVVKSSTYRTTQAPVNIGNAFKSAATDAFKKCASELGLCRDIYTQEIKEQEKGNAVLSEETHSDHKITERLEHFLRLQDSIEGIENVVNEFQKNGKMNEKQNKLVNEYYRSIIEKSSHVKK